ncbi:unnamed protein product [Polarella glacialis]|uniref:Protein kinase domain-containing protein n=1 Tax=Polarella glacialis TaxID=89957 RepID=A0A813GVS4_POLGL|nr:unnamed protein product [Polarella glacialis]
MFCGATSPCWPRLWTLDVRGLYTPNYRAPELWKKRTTGPTLASEAWAFGCCLAEVWIGRILFHPVKESYGWKIYAANGPGPIIRHYVKVQTQKHNAGYSRSVEAQADKPNSWERSWESSSRALLDFVRGKASG